MSARARHWRSLVVPAVTFLAVTLALLAWTDFTADPAGYVRPGLLVGLVTVGAGTAARWWRVPGPLVVLVQVLLGGMATSVAICGALLPLGSAAGRLTTEFARANHTILTTEAPVQVSGPGVGPYLVLGAFLCYLLADVLAVTLDRPPVAGLVLLGVIAVPLSVPGGDLPWLMFVVVAAGFLLLVSVHQKDRVSRWGRDLETSGGISTLAPGTGRRGLEAGAGVIGSVAVVLALVVPAVVPTLDLDVAGFGEGDGDGEIRVTNPSVGMLEDLREQSPTELVRVRVPEGGQAPSYLRIASLTSFNGRLWTPGNREVPADQVADGPMELPPGGRGVLGRERRYELTATPAFRSTWLPTLVHTTRIEADGDWRYDRETMDFIAADDDLDTAGRSWTVLAAPLAPDKNALLAASSTPNLVDSRFTALPDMPAELDSIAAAHTADRPSPFEKAVALQSWFRDSGEFTYSLDRPDTVTGTGSEDLMRFLTTERVGYCQQYATAMAALARSIDIPARVSIGFLRPEQVDEDEYVFRASDLHAWPELWFDGIGWVMFDPTPPDVSGRAPAYTRDVLGSGTGTGAQDPSQPLPDDLPSTAPEPGADPRERQPAPDTATEGATGGEESSSWPTVLMALLVVAVLTVLAAPAVVRRRRRARRLAGSPEECWAEVRDTAVDLGLPWSDDLSPRSAGRALVAYVPTPPGRAALERVVLAVERDRYARTPSGAVLEQDTRAVLADLVGAAETRAVRRARLWPRSVLTRRPRGGADVPGGRSAAPRAERSEEAETTTAGR